MRLDKFLSNLKFGSRKDIKIMVKNGLVMINNHQAVSSDVKIDPIYDKISVNGKEVFYQENIIVAFNKPKGYLSSHHDEAYPSLFNLIGPPMNQFDLKIAGRLDYDSEGLMILTTSGQLIHKITHPKKHIQKVYEATLNRPLEQSSLEQLLDGVELIDTDGTSYHTKAIKLSSQGNLATITIDEGKFHQVKKMFKHVGYEVINLKRIQVGLLKLDLDLGQYKVINESDIFGR